jgi:single-stranded-DNA-specific exonuclease
LELNVRPLDVMMCDDPQKAEILAEEVMILNDKRKFFQAELEEKILGQLKSEENSSAVVLQAQGHAGVVGLIATKVTQLTGKPAFIVAIHEGEGVGSARGAEENNLPLGLATASAFLDRFGGHAQAAGFSLDPKNFENFKLQILSYYKNLKVDEIQKERTFDVEAKVSEFNENFMTWLKQAGPFGAENPTPLFKVVGVVAKDVKWLKEQHLKLILTEGAQEMEAIAFFAKGLFEVEKGMKVELLAEPSWNYFRGQRRIQLLIRDLKTV